MRIQNTPARFMLLVLLMASLALPVAAQEDGTASEEEIALFHKAEENLLAASSWQADFNLAFHIDGDITMPGMQMTADIEALTVQGQITVIDHGAAFALEETLASPLLELAPETPGHLTIQLVNQDGLLHTTMQMDGETISMPAMPTALLLNFDILPSGFQDPLTTMMDLMEEHRHYQRLPAGPGSLSLQSELDLRALMLDPQMPVWLLNWLPSLDSMTAEFALQPQHESPQHDHYDQHDHERSMSMRMSGRVSTLAEIFGLAQFLIEEATLREVRTIDSERAQLQKASAEVEMFINLDMLAPLLSDMEGNTMPEEFLRPFLKSDDSQLRLLMKADVTLSGINEELTIPRPRRR